MQIPVKDTPGLVKDLTTGALLSKDDVGRAARLAERERVRQQKSDHDRINELEKRVASLEQILNALTNQPDYFQKLLPT